MKFIYEALAQFSPYASVYSREKIKELFVPLVKEPIRPMSEGERRWMEMEDSLLKPQYWDPHPYLKPPYVIRFPSLFDDTPSWRKISPIYPDPTGDVIQDAYNEYKLIEDLNKPGNIKARRDFDNVQRYLNGKLNKGEWNLLKVADIRPNESLAKYFPDINVSADMFRDYWRRWFGGKRNKYPKLNHDIYWVPYDWLMEDPLVNEQFEDLKANLFIDKAKDLIVRELRVADKITDNIEEFDFSLEDPLLWKNKIFQERAVNYYSGWDMVYAPINPKYWAMGNFSINALPKGYVIPRPEGGHKICVTEVYTFMHDTFNFEGLQWLGLWDLDNPAFPSFGIIRTNLRNGIFQNFREKYGYGSDFTLLSPLKRVGISKEECWNID